MLTIQLLSALFFNHEIHTCVSFKGCGYHIISSYFPKVLQFMGKAPTHHMTTHLGRTELVLRAPPHLKGVEQTLMLMMVKKPDDYTEM